jgi:flagellar motor component MotA
MEKTPKENDRNDTLGELLVEMVETSREHGLNAVDILVSFMNNRMLQEERDDIMDLLKKED